jgi:hypothetical protein
MFVVQNIGSRDRRETFGQRHLASDGCEQGLDAQPASGAMLCALRSSPVADQSE